jgi:hypothetical protein
MADLQPGTTLYRIADLERRVDKLEQLHELERRVGDLQRQADQLEGRVGELEEEAVARALPISAGRHGS